MVHICKLGVLYQVFGKVFVTGIFPKNRRFILTFQNPKLGIEITRENGKNVFFGKDYKIDVKSNKIPKFEVA